MADVLKQDQAQQNALLETASKKVKEQAFYMKRAMDQSDLKQALNFAKEMLRELRSQDLTPRNYYELYMKVLDELRYLEEFFMGLIRAGTLCSELYEQVQSCGMVLPRLYLLITVGAAYIKSKQAPAKDILKDLVEMAKGVQHPMRGLFLRNYLAHVARDKLPDTGSEYAENGGGTVHNALDFVITNFSETNRLWVRMQSGGKGDKKKREKERNDLRILVGTNLVRLSQLEGVDVATYTTEVLPKVLEQVVNCKDVIAQTYLMDCVIHVFPDEFHLNTLEPFLQTCTQLKEKVSVRTILESMMDRLANGGASGGQEGGQEGSVVTTIPESVDAFKMFNECVSKVLERSVGMELAEVLRLHKALLNFALKCYPGNLAYVNHCLGQAVAVLNAKANGGGAADEKPTPSTKAQAPSSALDEASVMEVESLLSIPLSTLALQVLELDEYSDILAFLPWESRRQVAIELVRAVLNTRHSETLGDLPRLEKLFAMITPLLRDDPNAGAGGSGAASADGNDDDAGGGGDDASDAFEREQGLVSRLVHLMRNEDTDEQFGLFLLARKQFGQGGVTRIKHTLVPLVFAALKLSQTVRTLEKQEEPPTLKYSSRKMFQFVHEIVSAMASSGYPDLSLKLFLQCAQAADKCEFNAIAYEFVSQASILYEDELSDSKAQVRALNSMVGTLLSCRNFSAEDYDTLVTKTTQYAAKLLKKPDQCRMVTLASHLFWVGKAEEEKHYHDARRVLECLQRSLKIADVCMSSSMHVHLFVEILNQYLYYFENDAEVITEKYISGLIALINEHIENMEASEQRSEVEAHYRNTLAHIRGMQQAEKTQEKFEGIILLADKSASAPGN